MKLVKLDDVLELIDGSMADLESNYENSKLQEEIKRLPTVDAELVIRCKDCKYFDHSDFGKGEEYWCKHFVSTDDYTHCHKVTEDDFCAWGERREDE